MFHHKIPGNSQITLSELEPSEGEVSLRNLVIGCAVLAVVFVYAALPGVTAQTPAGNVVLVPVRVADAKNVPVSTLKQENFQLL